MTVRTRYDAVVIGGGHNGLIAATYLAHSGQSVLVLERNGVLGGATTSEHIFPGFDARLSRYSYLVSLLPRKIVRDLGLHFRTAKRSMASCTPYERNGRLHALLLSNVDTVLSHASFEVLAGRSDWHNYLKLLEMEQAFAARIWPSLLRPLQSREDWQSSMRTPLEKDAWNAFVEHPLGEWLERSIQDDIVRGMLFTDGKIGIFTHPHDESLLQNRCFILHVIGQGTGQWQVPVGGMGTLIHELERAASEAGVQCLTDAPAEAIHQGTQCHTVEFRRNDVVEAVDATRVLVSAGPQVFDQLMGKIHMHRTQDEGSVCKVNMLLRRLPRLKSPEISVKNAFAGTFHLGESYGEMLQSYDQAARGELPDRPPAEMYCHTLTDNTILGTELRRGGYHTLTLFGLDVPYRLFEKNHDAMKGELLDRYLRGLNEVLLDPIEDCLAHTPEGAPCIEIKTPQDLERDISLHEGNIFHGELSWFYGEGGADSDGSRVPGAWGVETPHERIYRCGASAVRGGGVSGIPGYNAAQCIFAELGQSKPRTARARKQ